MISHGVDISIAAGVVEMVLPNSYGISVFLFLYIMYSLLWYKNSHAALAMA